MYSRPPTLSLSLSLTHWIYQVYLTLFQFMPSSHSDEQFSQCRVGAMAQIIKYRDVLRANNTDSRLRQYYIKLQTLIDRLA